MNDESQKRASNTAWVPETHSGDCIGPPSVGSPWCNHDAHWKVVGTWTRANFVPAPNYYNLNQAALLLNRAFGGFGCYLVGSSLYRRDYRDVDVRLILSDEEYAHLFHGPDGWTNPLWSLLCTSLSLWLKQQTDLPVDFQIQQQTNANAEHKGKRSALGVFMDYPGERPSDAPPGQTKGPR